MMAKATIFHFAQATLKKTSVSLRKYCPFLEKKNYCKNEKKVPIRTFLNHPAATPETKVFFSMAPRYAQHEEVTHKVHEGFGYRLAGISNVKCFPHCVCVCGGGGGMPPMRVGLRFGGI